MGEVEVAANRRSFDCASARRASASRRKGADAPLRMTIRKKVAERCDPSLAAEGSRARDTFLVRSDVTHHLRQSVHGHAIPCLTVKRLTVKRCAAMRPSLDSREGAERRDRSRDLQVRATPSPTAPARRAAESVSTPDAAAARTPTQSARARSCRRRAGS